MTGHSESSKLHWPSHASLVPLLAPPVTASGTAPDAIVVPAGRPARNLMTVIDLAKAVGCHLVVLCSMRTRPAIVRALCAVKNLTNVSVVEIPDGYDHPFLRFETSEWTKTGPGRAVRGTRDSDVSMKRNIGLLIALMLGWRHIFFMDDDIRTISADDLIRTVSLLNTDEYRSASMRVKHFPDNSVVCHARRAVGEPQDVFVTGSVLAVDTTAPIAFFPDVYNEDWLFFHQDVAQGRIASPGWLHARQVKQVKYHPFDDPQRAACEEFGDVLSEGLYALLHHGLGEDAATVDYWSAFLHDRRVLLDEISGRLHHARKELRCDIDKAIETARRTLSDITPDLCLSFLTAWDRDLRRWSALRDTFPSAGSVPEALDALCLQPG